MIRNARHLPLTEQMPLGRRQERPVLRQSRPVEATHSETGVVAVVALPEEKAAAVCAEAALAVRRGRVHFECRFGCVLDGGLGQPVGAEDEGAGVFAALLALACGAL